MSRVQPTQKLRRDKSKNLSRFSEICPPNGEASNKSGETQVGQCLVGSLNGAFSLKTQTTRTGRGLTRTVYNSARNRIPLLLENKFEFSVTRGTYRREAVWKNSAISVNSCASETIPRQPFGKLRVSPLSKIEGESVETTRRDRSRFTFG